MEDSSHLDPFRLNIVVRSKEGVYKFDKDEVLRFGDSLPYANTQSELTLKTLIAAKTATENQSFMRPQMHRPNLEQQDWYKEMMLKPPDKPYYIK